MASVMLASTGPGLMPGSRFASPATTAAGRHTPAGSEIWLGVRTQEGGVLIMVAATGIVFVVLVIVGSFIAGQPPKAGDPIYKITAFAVVLQAADLRRLPERDLPGPWNLRGRRRSRVLLRRVPWGSRFPRPRSSPGCERGP